MTELSATILELIYENNINSVNKNSKPVYEEHKIIEKNTWNFVDMYIHCYCFTVNTLYFFELEDFIMINRQKHYTKYLHDKLEIKDIRCIYQGR